MKRLLRINQCTGEHWVGDAFYVNTLFSYYHDKHDISPFLLLDYAKPRLFSSTMLSRGVGYHPHRGFETVTLVFAGEIEHQDTGGHSGKVSAGDVQWMTAGEGILHEEKLSAEFLKHGGEVEMVQLWVNLPSSHKFIKSKYQEILKDTIPTITLPNDTGRLRVIAGNFQNTSGAAQTFTPINIWDAYLNKRVEFEFSTPQGHTLMILVLRGHLILEHDAQVIHSGCVGIFSSEGTSVKLKTEVGTHVLIMSGQVIDEPLVGQGPFVMNTKEEIQQAIDDYHLGKFGLSPNG